MPVKVGVAALVLVLASAASAVSLAPSIPVPPAGAQPAAPTFRIMPSAAAAEGSDASLAVTLSRAAPAGGLTLAVSYGYSGSSATAADTGAPPTAVTVPQGRTAATLSVPTAQDALLEGAETFTVTIGRAAATAAGWQAASASATATVTITDDESGAAQIAFGDDPTTTRTVWYSLNENRPWGTFELPVTISHLPQTSVTFTIAVDALHSDAATENTDYVIRNETVTFGPSDSSTAKSVGVTLIDDAEIEGYERIDLRIVAPDDPANGLGDLYTRHGLGARAWLTIADDDTASEVVLGTDAPAGPVAEDVGSVVVTAELDKPTPTGSTVTVSLATSGSATATEDYRLLRDTISIAAGATAGSATIAVVDDAKNEQDETVVVTGTALVSGQGPLPVLRTSFTITDPTPTLNTPTDDAVPARPYDDSGGDSGVVGGPNDAGGHTGKADNAASPSDAGGLSDGGGPSDGDGGVGGLNGGGGPSDPGGHTGDVGGTSDPGGHTGIVGDGGSSDGGGGPSDAGGAPTDDSPGPRDSHIGDDDAAEGDVDDDPADGETGDGTTGDRNIDDADASDDASSDTSGEADIDAAAGIGDAQLADTAAARFDDIDRMDYYAAPVGWMLANELTTGCEADNYCQGAPTTRAHFVTFLWRAAGKPVPLMTGSELFSDVDATSFADAAIGWAGEQGVTTGCTTGNDATRRFCPDDPATRGQIATLLYRYTGPDTDSDSRNTFADVARDISPDAPTGGQDQPFADVARDSFYAAAIGWAGAQGITNGCVSGDDTPRFCPDHAATRGEVATFLYRVAITPTSRRPGGGIVGTSGRPQT